MKSFSRIRILFLLLGIGLLTATGKLHAASSIRLTGSSLPGGNIMVYERTLNPSIGITAGNANGAIYTITDENGKVVMTGSIRSSKTFYIATGKFGSGLYCFRIGGQVMQQFIVR